MKLKVVVKMILIICIGVLVVNSNLIQFVHAVEKDPLVNIVKTGGLNIKQSLNSTIASSNNRAASDFNFGYNPNLKNKLRDSDDSRIVVLKPKDIKTTLEGEYAFVPRYSKGNTKITVFREGKAESYKKSTISFTKKEVEKGASILFENVGYYKGRQIDLREEIVAVDSETTFGLYKGGSKWAYDEFLAVSATGGKITDKAQVRYVFIDHKTQQEAKITGYITFSDIDHKEAINIFDSNIEHAYVLSTSPIVGDIDASGNLHLQPPKRTAWDSDWNVPSDDQTRWISVTVKNTSRLNMAITTVTTEPYKSAVIYDTRLLVPLNYPNPNKIAINQEENKDLRKIEYSIISQVPAKVIPVAEPRYIIQDELPKQFKVDSVEAINRETGVKKDFDITIEDRKIRIDGKKFLNDASFYNKVYEFKIKGSYTKGSLSEFETAEEDDNYVVIPNTAKLIVSNVDETERVLESNEAIAPVLKHAGKVTTKYLEKDTAKVLAKESVLEGELNESYETTAAQIDGYDVVETPVNAKGHFTKSEQEVIYFYQKKEPALTFSATKIYNHTFAKSNQSSNDISKVATGDRVEITNDITVEKNKTEHYTMLQTIEIPKHSNVSSINFNGKNITSEKWQTIPKNEQLKTLKIELEVDATGDPLKSTKALKIALQVQKGYQEAEKLLLLKKNNTVSITKTAQSEQAPQTLTLQMTTNLLQMGAEALNFGEHKIAMKEAILNRSSSSSPLTFTDTRREPEPLTLSVKSSAFTDKAGNKMGAELYYYEDNEGISTLDVATPIIEREGYFPNEIDWQSEKGLRLFIPKKAMKTGAYRSILTWTFSNVPSNK